jgi:clan AA aspartic protease (TIGR02281 family)
MRQQQWLGWQWLGWFSMGAIALSGCQGLPNPSADRPDDPAPAATPASAQSAPVAPSPSATPQPVVNSAETFQTALDRAYSAAKLTQSAQIPADWQFVMSRWQEAIELLKTLPANSPEYPQAQTKIREYQSNLAYATQRAAQPVVTPPSTIAMQPMSTVPAAGRAPANSGGSGSAAAGGEAGGAPAAAPAPSDGASNSSPSPDGASSKGAGPMVAQAPIIGRFSGIPVIEVKFNGRSFPMMVDTGASSTVVTRRMAAALGLQPHDKVTVTTPSDRAVQFEVARVDSAQVGSLVINNLEVAIAPTMEVGLLGQNFFGAYDVTIRSDQVEFHAR